MQSRLILAATLGVTLAAPALAQQPPSGQQQNQQSRQQQPVAQQQGTARQPNVVNRTKQDPNVIVLIPLEVEQRIPAEQRAHPVKAEDLYSGFRASRLMGQDVFGPNGN